jgi:hypothetical protein
MSKNQSERFLIMKLSQVRVISTALLISILSSCSGAGSGVASLGDGSGGGIGGSGVTSSGTINGFGSIFVNGVEFETDTADIVINGDTSTDSALRLGMIVLVTGTLNEDGVTGTADRVEFSNEVQGPIESIVGGSDGNTALIMVLGTQIIVERTTTVFDSAVFNSLAIGDLVEISGFPTSAGRLVATRVERISAFISGESEVELSGIVTRLSGTLFELNNVVVDFGSADVSQLRGGTISQGLAVAVRGTLEDGILLAERITDRAEIARDLDDDDSVTVQGSVSNFSSLAMFKIGGLMVDGSSASLEPDSIALDNGSIVEVEGLAEELSKSKRVSLQLTRKIRPSFYNFLAVPFLSRSAPEPCWMTIPVYPVRSLCTVLLLEIFLKWRQSP